MCPADATPVIAIERPYIDAKGQSPCQASPRSQSALRSPSGGFLLLNFEPPYRDHLLTTLRHCRYRVIVPEDEGKTYFDLTDDEVRNADYVFCDLTRRVSHEQFQRLRHLCTVRKTDGPPILAACFISEDAPPGFQLLVEALFGARIVLCKTTPIS
jgi:hypothetical protein